MPNINTLILTRNYEQAANELLRYGVITEDSSEEIDGNHSRYQAVELDGVLWRLIKRNGQVIHISN